MEIKTKDKIVQNVLRKMDERSLIGQKKYGATMMEEIKGQKKDLGRFIVDVQEELMDAILYLESARHCLQDEIEEAIYAKARRVNENINDIKWEDTIKLFKDMNTLYIIYYKPPYKVKKQTKKIYIRQKLKHKKTKKNT